MTDTDIIELDKSDKSFIDIKNNLKKFGLKVDKVLKISTPHLKHSFEAELVNLKQRKPKEFNSNITSLYHGTQANWKQLAYEGLDQRLSRKGRFGRGIYFSDNPLKCCKYATKENNEKSEDQFLLICNVILGDIKEFEKGQEARDLKKEPVKECIDNKVIYFDSVKGQPKDSTEFVVYDRLRVLIEYIVFYSPLSAPEDRILKQSSISTATKDHETDSEDDDSSDGSSDLIDSVHNSEDEVTDIKRPITKTYPKFETPVMIQQKNAALLHLMDYRTKVTPQDLKELIFTFIQTYGPDDTLNKFFPDIISTLGPIQSSKNSLDTVSKMMKQEIQNFQEITGCKDLKLCKKYLKEANMNVQLAISTYFDDNAS